MKSISDYAELYRETQVNAQPQMPISKVMAGIGVKDPNLQKVLATAMLKYLTDNGINQNNFSLKTMQFLAQQSGDKDAIALAMAKMQQQNPNVFKDDPVTKPVVNQQTVDANGDGNVSADEKVALDLANAISRSWIQNQLKSSDPNVQGAAKNVVNTINKVLADLKVTVPQETKLLQAIQANLKAIPNWNKSPYWLAVNNDITALLQATANPQ